MFNRSISGLVCGIALLLSTSVLAACGGGGWHSSSRSSDGSNKTSQSADSNSAQNVSYSRPASNDTAAISALSLDTKRFDAMSSRMDLTDRQYRDIESMRRGLREEGDRLSRAYNKAQNKLARCSGDCSDEIKKVERTGDALKAFDPNREFDQRLSGILSSRQMDMYREKQSSSLQPSGK